MHSPYRVRALCIASARGPRTDFAVVSLYLRHTAKTPAVVSSRSVEVTPMADEKAQNIKAWQDKLLAKFSLNGAPGGRHLASAIAAEQKTGAEFMDKWYGHRVLTDSFMEFFGATLQGQWSFNNTKGWPQNAPYHVPCFVLYLVAYRSIRASEVLSANGYFLPAYASQRTIRDQLMILGGAANALMQFDELFGWKDLGPPTGPKSRRHKRSKIGRKPRVKFDKKRWARTPDCRPKRRSSWSIGTGCLITKFIVPSSPKRVPLSNYL